MFSALVNRASLLVKSAVIVTLCILVVSATLTLLYGNSSRSLTRASIDERGIIETDLVASSLYGATKFSDVESARAILSDALESSGGAGYAAVILLTDGTVFADATLNGGDVDALIARATPLLAEGLVDHVLRDGLVMHPIAKSRAATSADNPPVGVIAVDWRPTVALANTAAAERQAVMWSALVAVAMIGIAIWAVRQMITRPLGRVRDAIGRIGSGDLTSEVPAQDRRDEIGVIASSVEDLRRILHEAEAGQRDAAYKGAAFSSASACLMLVDSDLTIRFANAAMTALMASHREHIPGLRNQGENPQIVGMTMKDFHPSDDRVLRRLRDLGRGTMQIPIAFGDARIELTISPVIDAADTQIGLILEWKDVTQDWLNDAILHALDANQIRADFSVDGNLISANPSFCKAMGLAMEDLRGRHLGKLIGQVDATAPQATDILAAARSDTSTAQQMTLAGGQRDENLIVDGTFTCVKDSAGKPVRFLLMGKDVTRIETDLREARAARRAAERDQTVVVEALRVGLRSLSTGDLTALIEEPFAGTYEDLRLDYNSTVKTLADAMRGIMDNADNISNEARDISSTADGLSRRTENTAATLEQTAAALNELTSSVQSSAKGAGEADLAVRDAKKNAEDSGKVVLETVSAMDQIAESSGRITSIIKVIDDIAFQTNLLALNAGVEAARAGDAGRGFAVVASEVRALAQRSSDAAREINDLIEKSSGQVKRGVDLVGRTGDALQQIVNSVSRISGLVSAIADSALQQSTNLAEINNSVNQLDQSTQQNAARLEETTAASESLRKDAVSLVETVGYFKLNAAQAVSDVVPFRTRSRALSETAAPRVPDRPVEKVAASAQGWEDF